MELIVEFLNTPLGGITSLIEVIGFIAGAVCVGLAARQSIWNWPIGILNSAAWLILFAGIGLYADMSLQAIYIATGVWGWYHWLRGGPRQADDLPVTRMPALRRTQLAAVALAGFVLMGLLLEHFTNSTVPWADAAPTTLSLLAQYLLIRKHVESWPVWIFGVNIPFALLYIYKGLYLTAALQPVFIALSVLGWISWRRELHQRQAAAELLPA